VFFPDLPRSVSMRSDMRWRDDSGRPALLPDWPFSHWPFDSLNGVLLLIHGFTVTNVTFATRVRLSSGPTVDERDCGTYLRVPRPRSFGGCPVCGVWVPSEFCLGIGFDQP
jgi:hypothetical protein